MWYVHHLPESMKTPKMCESNGTSRSTLEENYRRATTQEPIMNGGSLVSPGLATQRERGLTAIVPKSPDAVGWAPSSVDRPADYLPPGTVGQWLPVPCNGGPCERAATRKPTKRPRGLTQNSRAGNPKRTRPKLPTDRILSNQRGLQRTKRGGGPKTPLCKGKGPENPGVVAPFPVADCRGNRMRAVVCASTRWSMSLLCCPTEFCRYSQ